MLRREAKERGGKKAVEGWTTTGLQEGLSVFCCCCNYPSNTGVIW